jgi:phage protein U
MMGQLGSIVFERLKEPLDLIGCKKWTYADHPIIREETKLQYTGHEPREYQFRIRFHASFCDDPKVELARLEAAAQTVDAQDNLMPIQLILDSGDVLGAFVITEIKREYVKLFPDGRVLEVVATVSLREFV